MNSTDLPKMTLPEPSDRESPIDETDFLLRVSRRAFFIVLLMILGLGATLLGRAVWPDSVLGNWPARWPWLLPVLVATGLTATRLLLRGRAWDAKSQEVRRIRQDEFRRANFLRAQRVALIVVLVLQVPLGLLFADLPGMRAVMAMAVTTITLGMTVLIGLFLVFDRE